jgi:hypothetical protein
MMQNKAEKNRAELTLKSAFASIFGIGAKKGEAGATKTLATATWGAVKATVAWLISCWPLLVVMAAIAAVVAIVVIAVNAYNKA